MSLRQNCNNAFTEIEKIRSWLIEDNKIIVDAVPRHIVEAHARCSGWYSFLCSREAECIAERAKWWEYSRQDHKSDSSTMKAWERTEVGILQSRIELEKKGIERIVNAFNRIEDNIERELKLNR